MIRAAKTIFVFSIGLLGCNRDPMISRRPQLVSHPRAAGTIGWRCGLAATVEVDAGLAAEIATVVLRRIRSAGRPRRCGDDSKPRPGCWHGLPGSPDAPVSRPSDAGVTVVLRTLQFAAERRRRDGWSCGRSNLAAERRRRDGWFCRRTGHSPAGRRGDAGRWRHAATSVRCGCESDRRLVARSDAQPLPGTVLPGGACTDSGQCASLPADGRLRARPSDSALATVRCPAARSLVRTARAGPLPCASQATMGRSARDLRSWRKFLVPNRLRVPVGRSAPPAGGMHTRMSRQHRLHRLARLASQ